MLKKVLALTLILTLSLSLNLSPVVYANESGNVTGDGTVYNPIINVVVNTTLPFTMDRFQAKATMGQLYLAEPFAIINKSQIPVMVQYTLKSVYATNGTDPVTFKATTADVYPYDTTKKTKDIYMTIQLPVTAAIDTASSSATTSTTITGTFATTAETLVPFDVTGEVSFSVALDKAVYASAGATEPDDLASNNNGITGFKFYGLFNTYADWQDNDISIKGTYKISGIIKSGYDQLQFINGTHHLVDIPVFPPFTGAKAGFLNTTKTANDTTLFSVTSSKASDVSIAIPFYFGAYKVDDILFGSTSMKGQYVTHPGSYEIVFIKSVSSNLLRTHATNGLVTVTVKLSNGMSYPFRFNVTN